MTNKQDLGIRSIVYRLAWLAFLLSPTLFFAQSYDELLDKPGLKIEQLRAKEQTKLDRARKEVAEALANLSKVEAEIKAAHGEKTSGDLFSPHGLCEPIISNYVEIHGRYAFEWTETNNTCTTATSPAGTVITIPLEHKELK